MKIVFPAEWDEQEFVQLTWPNAQTDWKDCLDGALKCYNVIAFEISIRQKLLIVADDVSLAKSQLSFPCNSNIYWAQAKIDDTWARDHGGITVYMDNKPVVNDFRFNGWGDKYDSDNDNQITSILFEQKVIVDAKYKNCNHFVLEGGSIESNGKGVLLTTEACLLHKNRNPNYSKEQIIEYICESLGIVDILWLKNGVIAGDDTDSHIDTLARFVDHNTIMYVQCTDREDVHYNSLKAMEEELCALNTHDGTNLEIIALPLPEAVYDEEGNRLPATYANFLIINKAVLVPIYNCETDNEALQIFSEFFTDREIVPVDCSVLIKQHGSLHCVTMNYPKGTGLNPKEHF